MWVPSHVGLPGYNLTVPHSDHCSHIRTQVLEQWQQSWNSETQNKLHAIEPRLNVINLFCWQRWDEIIFGRLKILHTYLMQTSNLDGWQSSLRVRLYCVQLYTTCTTVHYMYNMSSLHVQLFTACTTILCTTVHYMYNMSSLHVQLYCVQLYTTCTTCLHYMHNCTVDSESIANCCSLPSGSLPSFLFTQITSRINNRTSKHLVSFHFLCLIPVRGNIFTTSCWDVTL